MKIEFRIAACKGGLAVMGCPDRDIESRKASVRAKVEHRFLIIKRDFGFTKTRYRGVAKNLNHLSVLFASANLLMRGRSNDQKLWMSLGEVARTWAHLPEDDLKVQ